MMARSISEPKHGHMPKHPKRLGLQGLYKGWRVFYPPLPPDFTGLLPQAHGKVISRSQQGQISSKRVKIVCFCCFCYKYAPLGCL